MATLTCSNCRKIIEDEGALEDDFYICAECLEKIAEEDAWLEKLESHSGG